ncbi:Bacillopeptidase F [Orchesella cincta]|uniref:Bacillopeptidase F n=1 Tax=Orchesella cincta TaxID=48709 RepID=A0A1D2MFG7_ORCCI|nr:Bacillopeptidase F [Orchesella cincta]
MIRQLVIAALVGVALSAPSNKIDQSLAKTLSSKGSANVVIVFKQDTSDLIKAINSGRFASRGQKITTLKAGLEQLASTSQKNTVSFLQSKDAKFNAFWITNQIFVKDASAELVQAIAAFSEVVEIRQEQILYIDEPIPASNQINAEWGIEKIEAEAAWSLPGGNNGQGVVVATIDTGVRGTHESLSNNFRASKGWLDPYTNTASPTDGNGHGTHTMGTIVGSGGIGVAPGAQWISCRGCGAISCTEAALIACGQFTLCPTDADGSNADCAQAPNLVSNSWGGGQGNTFYDQVIDLWRQADIIPIFANGNAGPGCGSANSPGDSPKVIGVGATTADDGIASFSSLGPSVGGIIKPELSAPGQNVRSAWSTGDAAYNTISGTSMATPHVAGAAALILSANPGLGYDQVKDLLQNNADRDLQRASDCDGVPSDTFPNNVYGYGRINARKALAAAISGI